jgi:Arc/MetJ-type ribon-helix-helix transcriptional regulator
MVNKLVNLRLDSKLLKELDSIVRESSFSNRTEAIKDALRKFIDDYKTKKALQSLKKHFGEGKRLGIKEPTPEEFEKIREEVGNRILKEEGLI